MINGARLAHAATTAAASILFVTSPGGAQQVGVQLGVTTGSAVGTGAKFAIPVVVDLTLAGSTNLASLQSGVTWNAGRLTLDSIRKAVTGWTLLQTGPVGGSASFNASGPATLTSGITLANAYFTAAATSGGTRVTLQPTAATDQLAANILALLRPRGFDACVADRWGDANDDQSLDIIDAQQIARYGVGLSVANSAALLARGDVNEDESVNIIDAQQIARFSVALSAVPRLGTLISAAAAASVAVSPSGAQLLNVGSTLQLTATPKDAGDADLTGCSGITWSSTNSAAATVSADGLVTAVSAGAASIVATSSSNGALTASVPVTVSAPSGGTLRVSAVNPRYFTDLSGRAIYLTGSHTWNNLQDATNTGAPFAWTTYLDFLTQQQHNHIRLWTWEHTVWPDAGITYAPMPYPRTGPGLAIDGLAKFDLNAFDASYFTRLRQRVIEAGQRGIYVTIMLFNGFSIMDKGSGNPWPVSPFNSANNINAINGDPNNDGAGTEIQTLQVSAITAIQDGYVRHVIDVVNDLDNVLYEISNESEGSAAALAWQAHMIQLIKQYEAGKPKQHPVGMTALSPGGNDADLFASAADFISPASGGSIADTPAADGSKVILLDTDHICGICGDAHWVWRSFTRGVNPIFMDVYDGSYGPQGAANPSDPNWIATRLNLGYTRAYADRINLIAMVPHGELASTGYCLAKPTAQGAEYLVYAPSGGSVDVNLSSASGTLTVEWFFPATGQTVAGGTTTGGASRTFVPPSGGAAVLYIHP
jgi:hypothetical protein